MTIVENPQILLYTRVRKSPYFYSSRQHGVALYSFYNHTYHPRHYGDPVAGSAHPEDDDHDRDSHPDGWALLAQWCGFPGGIVFWTIRRQDLAERRFDRVEVQMHANP